MDEKIRVVCSECDKRLNCPASAAGKKFSCPSCGAKIRVPGAAAGSASGAKSTSQKPRRAASPQRKPAARKPRAQEDDFGDSGFDDLGDDPYQSPAASGLPPRASKSKKKTSAGKKKSAASGGEKPGDKRIKIGTSIFVGSLLTSVGKMAIFGMKSPTTAAERGEAVGFGVAVLTGIIVGVVFLVRGFLANRAHKSG